VESTKERGKEREKVNFRYARCERTDKVFLSLSLRFDFFLMLPVALQLCAGFFGVIFSFCQNFIFLILTVLFIFEFLNVDVFKKITLKPPSTTRLASTLMCFVSIPSPVFTFTQLENYKLFLAPYPFIRHFQLLGT
jgi:hypothetical protein